MLPQQVLRVNGHLGGGRTQPDLNNPQNTLAIRIRVP